MIVLECVQPSPEWRKARLGVLTASRVGQMFNGGGRPIMPAWYTLTRKGREATFRGSIQQEIVAALEARAHGANELEIPTGQSLKNMIDRGYVVERPPPPDAKPIAPPVTLSANRYKLMDRLVAEWATGDSAEEFVATHAMERGHELEGEALERFGEITGMTAKAVGLVYRNEARTEACSPDWMAEAFGVEVKCVEPWTLIGWRRIGGMPPEHEAQVQFSLWVTGFERWYFFAYHPDLPPLLIECCPENRWQKAFNEHVPTFIREMHTMRDLLRAEGIEPKGV